MAISRLDAVCLTANAARLVSTGASGGKQLGQRRTRIDDLDDTTGDEERDDDDDEVDDNSPSALDDDDLEPFDPGDDSDLGLDGAEEETIGLDTAVGFDESGDDLDFPDLGDEEEESWQTDEAENDDFADAESEFDSDEEDSGWAEADESSGLDDDDLDDDFDDEPADAGEDDGAEGLEDDTDLDDLELAALPALDINTEEEVGLPGFDGSDEIGGAGLLDEPLIEVAPGQTWKMLRPHTTRTTRVAWPSGSGVTRADGGLAAGSLATHGETLYVASAGLYCLRPDAHALRALPMREAQHKVRSAIAAVPYAQRVTLGEHEGTLQLAVIAGDQLHFSTDGGRSFSVQESPRVTHAGFTHSASGLRLWWRTADGQLGSDGGTVARPKSSNAAAGNVLAFHADGRRSIAWIEQQARVIRLIASQDAGRTFTTWTLQSTEARASNASDQGAAAQLETSGQAVLVVAGGDARCGVFGAELASLATNARPPATLADDEGEPFVYACVEHQDEWLVIRWSARADRPAPLVLASIDKQELGAPLALAVGYGDDGMLSVFVAGKEALMRIEASLDGEELA
jgi:hypothetical protein